MKEASDSIQPPAATLVAALEEIVRISEIEAKRLVETRKRAAHLGELFESRLSAAIERTPDDPKAPIFTPLADSVEAHDRLDTARKRESATLDVYAALMRLYAVPEARGTAEAIMTLMRQNRMHAFGDRTRIVPPMPTELVSVADGAEPPEEKRRQMMRLLLDHHEAGRKQRRDRQAHFDEKIAASNALIEEALQLARSLPEEA